MSIERLYFPPDRPDLPARTLSIDLDKIMRKAIRRVYDKRLQAGELDAKTWRNTTLELWEASQKGTGKFLINTAYSSSSYELLTQFRHNLMVFAAFKNHREVNDLVDLLRDGDQLRIWPDFRDRALLISKEYNETWLRAEYEAAVGAGQMGQKWKDYEDNPALSFIQYETQRDSRVRPGHAKLDRTTLPISDPFWDEWFPPNGWGCRCGTRQVAATDPVRPESLPTDTEAPPAFRFNPGRTGQIFSEKHPYFSGIKPEQRENLLRAVAKLAYDNYSREYRKIALEEKTGGYLVAHRRHGKSELELNEPVGRKLAALGESVELLAKVRTGPSPSAIRDGLVFHFLQIGKDTNIEKAIEEGMKNARRVLLILDKDIDVEAVKKAARGVAAADEAGRLLNVDLLTFEGRLIRLSRKQKKLVTE